MVGEVEEAEVGEVSADVEVTEIGEAIETVEMTDKMGTTVVAMIATESATVEMIVEVVMIAIVTVGMTVPVPTTATVVGMTAPVGMIGRDCWRESARPAQLRAVKRVVQNV